MTDMPMEENSAAVSGARIPAGPGEQLAAQRKAQGWTVEQVARQLNLAPRQIQALEEDNHAALPGVASVRGFVRSYAKLLRIDPESLLSLIPGEVPTSISEPIPMRRALSKPFADDRLTLMGKRSSVPWKTLILSAIVATVLVAAYVADRAGWFLPVRHSTLLQHAEAPALVVAPPPPMPADVAPRKEADAAAETAVQEDEPPVSAQAQPAVAADDALVLNFREESWLEVKRTGQGNKDGEVLASRLVPAGGTETFDAGTPLSIVIGNAAGVDASLRGKLLDLKPDSKSNVARLTVK